MTSASRFHGLDALRSLSMLLGILVHTTTLAEFGRLESIAVLSGFFRMATFYAASAFLTSMVLSGRPAAEFLRRRLRTLGLPLLVALLVLNPPTLWLVAAVHNPGTEFGLRDVLAQALDGGGPLQGPLFWHLHLWFLFPLIAFTALSPPLHRMLASHRAQRWAHAATERVPPILRLPVLALLTLALCLLVHVASEAIPQRLLDVWVLQATLLYLPFHVLGMLLFHVPQLWRSTRGAWLLVPALAAVALATLLTDGSPEGVLPSLVRFALESAITTGLVLLLFTAAMTALNRESPAIRFLVDGIYTLYLIHYLLIYLIGWSLSPLDLPPTALFWTVALSATAAGLAFHALLVRRSAILSLLLNGAPPRPTRAPPAPVGPAQPPEQV